MCPSKICFKDIHGTKTKRVTKTNTRSSSFEQVLETNLILPAINKDPEGIPSAKHMAGKSRSEGCIPTCTNKPIFSRIPSLSLENKVFPICSDALWPVHSPSSLPGFNELSTQDNEIRGRLANSLPRRLDRLGTIPGVMQSPHDETMSASRVLRFHSKPGEIGASSQTKHSLVGGTVEFRNSANQTPTGKK